MELTSFVAGRRHAAAVGARFTGDLAAMFEMVALSNQDRYDLSIPIAHELYAEAMTRHSRFAAAIAKLQAMNGAVLEGDLHAATDLGFEALAPAEPLRDCFISGTVSSNRAWTLGQAGRLDEAQQRLDRLIRTVHDAGPDVDVVDLAVGAGKLQLWAGRLDTAERWLRAAAAFDLPGEAAAMARRLGTPHAEADALDELDHLAGADLEVPAGTVTAVLGPNGAGKTTAVRVLTTLTEPDEGEARVAGLPTSTMPSLLRTVAEWSPVTALADALRVQFGNPNTPTQPGDPWPIAQPVAYTAIWIVAMVAVCAPAAIRAYQRSIIR